MCGNAEIHYYLLNFVNNRPIYVFITSKHKKVTTSAKTNLKLIANFEQNVPNDILGYVILTEKKNFI